MGVHGLWKLLEPSGKPVALETLDDKVLAIDVSMWLHQVMKGYQDSTGNALPNAHLLGLFHRICKLLFYRIRPVFVFDGGVPQLKQQTMASRRHQRSKASRQAERNRLILLRNLAEQGVVRQALGAAIRPSGSVAKPSAFSDYILDPLPQIDEESSEEEGEDEVSSSASRTQINWENFDPESDDFKRLPAKERLEILHDLNETRKQNSWARINEMPQESGEFSGFQMRRLLVRRSAQLGLEQVERELGEQHTLTMSQLEEIMGERGSLANTLANMSDNTGSRIASDTTTRYLLLKGASGDVPKNTEPKGKCAVGTTENHRKEGGQFALIEILDEQDALDEEDPNPDDPNVEISQAEILAVIKSSRTFSSPPFAAMDPNLPSTSSAGYYVPEPPKDPPKSDENTNTALPEELLESIATIKVPETPTVDPVVNATDSGTSSEPSVNTPVANVSQPANADRVIIEINLRRESTMVSRLQRETPKPTFNSTKESGTQHLTYYLESDPEKVRENCVVGESPKVVCNEEPESAENDYEDAATNSTIEDVSIIIEGASSEGEEDQMSSNSFDSSSSSSSDSDSCFEVVSEDEVQSEKPKLEIKINPLDINGAALTDDLFADVFEEPSKKDDDLPEISDSEDSVKSPDVASPKAPAEKPQKASTIPPNITDQELVQLEAALVNEGKELANEAGRQERLAASISDQMCLEAQQLLQLFGLPWVVAPMEAEAQCAMLDLLSLTQGTVTDDSDIWLFGGRTVYRNFFNQSKSVEMYSSDAIQRCFKLSRAQLVLLAMLVGSDYTSGLAGVGPVTALEILAAFPGSSVIQQPDELVGPLKKFKDWWSKREQLSPSSRLKRLANKLRDLSIHEGFPSEAVAEAYLHPAVDDSRETFTWGRPDIPALIKFAREKFGWNQEHSESILKPVIKRLEDTSVQKKLDSYFTVGPKESNVEEKLSTRVREAVSQLGATSDTEDDPQPATSTATPRATTAKPQRKPAHAKPSTLEAMRKALSRRPVKKPLAEPVAKPSSSAVPSTSKPSAERIPQREKDKESALQSKLKAIELFRKRKLDPTPRDKKAKRLTKDDHYLSESSDSD